MQSMLNLRAIHGVPICLSGITNPLSLSLSKEIADHDRRRKDMRKQRSLAREGVHANQEFIEIKGGDLDDILNDLYLGQLDFTAKAA
ncbi:hypothetical protein TanjilG_03259 [Lupinus angustifolius]|uniref:Uncharacterized protein n=1 Tax=Lupinus angustifolius TaxID=3871 RepID=A0A4P1RDJ2_LUPAN|nr:PREDICTED: uncharacterized protein LOC109351634 [Lupinus angustifolius]OIW08583.1 hypothetical protein TanjilG_03259 [Lupinus angustifolius]